MARILGFCSTFDGFSIKKKPKKNHLENYYDEKKKKREKNYSSNIYQHWKGSSSIVRTVHVNRLQQNCNEYQLMDTNNCRNHYRHNRIQCKWTWNLERNRTQNYERTRVREREQTKSVYGRYRTQSLLIGIFFSSNLFVRLLNYIFFLLSCWNDSITEKIP